MAKFTGNDVRDIRKKHELSRKELAEYLNVSPVTVEKWEQHGTKVIRSKYQQQLAALGGVGVAGLAAGLIAAPALLLPTAILGGVIGAGTLLSDDSLESAGKLLQGLKRLTPEERKTLFELSRKMHT